MVEEEKKAAEAPAEKEVGTMKTGDYMIHVSVHSFVIVSSNDKRVPCCGPGLHYEWQELEVRGQVSAISVLFVCSVALITAN